MATRQGRCWSCKIAFRWTYRARKRYLPRSVALAYCPRCAKKLAKTTHLYSGRWDEKTLPIFCMGGILNARRFLPTRVRERLYPPS